MLIKFFLFICINRLNVLLINVSKCSKHTSFVNNMGCFNNRKRNDFDKLFITNIEILKNVVNSYNLAEERPKTNLLLTVAYDGTKYCGFVGPCIFLHNYGINVDKYNPAVNSISNEILRVMTLIHGYFGKGRKKVKRSEVDLAENSPTDVRPAVSSSNYLPVNGIATPGDRGRSVMVGPQAEPVSDLRELEGELNREGSTPSGLTSGGEADIWTSNGCNGKEAVVEDTFGVYEKRFTLITSSRTDKGVHSLGTACQYLSFDREFQYEDLEKVHDSLNKMLPDDIRITSLIRAPRDDFHVRFDNLGKCYIYKIDFSILPSIFERNYYWQLAEDRQFINTLHGKYFDKRKEFSFEKLREACDIFVGKYNFTGFSRKSRGNERDQIKDPVCTIKRIDLLREDTSGDVKKLNIIISGDRFLYKMIRCIVSHLVLYGFNVLKLSDIKSALENGKEIPNIICAPGHGLYLHNVYFDDNTMALINESNRRYKNRSINLI